MQGAPTWDFGTMDGTTGERTVVHKGSSAAIGLPDFGKMEVRHAAMKHAWLVRS